MRSFRLERGEVLPARGPRFAIRSTGSRCNYGIKGNVIENQIKAPSFECGQGAQVGMGWVRNHRGPAVRDPQERGLNGVPGVRALVASNKQYQGRPLGGGNTALRPQIGVAHGSEGQVQMPKDHGGDGGRLVSSTLRRSIAGWNPLTSEVFGRKSDGLCGSEVMSRTISPLNPGDKGLSLHTSPDGQNTDCASSDITLSTTTLTYNHNHYNHEIPTNYFTGTTSTFKCKTSKSDIKTDTRTQNPSSSPQITSISSSSSTSSSTSSSAKNHREIKCNCPALRSFGGRYSPSRNKSMRASPTYRDHILLKRGRLSGGSNDECFDESFKFRRLMDGPSQRLQVHPQSKGFGVVPVFIKVHPLKDGSCEVRTSSRVHEDVARGLVGVRDSSCVGLVSRETCTHTTGSGTGLANTV